MLQERKKRALNEVRGNATEMKKKKQESNLKKEIEILCYKVPRRQFEGFN
jgi:hypothetical protein